MPTLKQKITKWETSLLDLSKRNKLLNCTESKRGFLAITQPDLTTLYRQLVHDEKKLSFVRQVTRDVDARVHSVMQLLKSAGAPLHVTLGDLQTSQTIDEQAKTLRLLKNKARLAFDEQGQNLLYLAVGFVRWYDHHAHNAVMNSPLLLVPVSLVNSAPSEPYYLQLFDDEIVINPTLAYIFSDRYHFEFPPFDSDHDQLPDYFAKLKALFTKQGWALVEECRLGIFSFQKINMYKDLVENEEKVLDNPVLRTMYASKPAPVDATPVDHDAISPAKVCQIISADSSQLDAVERSRKGESFVLQGPPGTGKSQTITNIIAQALADGKRVLFVSEKMAALQVVYSRLVKAGLGDFCLPLHDHKANKREILQMIGDSLDKRVVRSVPGAASDAQRLALLRGRLQRYPQQLHQQREPLGMSLYDAFGKLVHLHETPTVLLPFPEPENVTSLMLVQAEERLQQLAGIEQGLTVPIAENPWRNYRADLFGQEHRLHAVQLMNAVCELSRSLREALLDCSERFGWQIPCDTPAVARALQIAGAVIALPAIPDEWIGKGLDAVRRQLIAFAGEQEQYHRLVQRLKPVVKALPDDPETLSAYADVPALHDRLNRSGVHADNLPAAAAQLDQLKQDFGAWLQVWRAALPELWQEEHTLDAARDIWDAIHAICALPAFSMQWLDKKARDQALRSVRRLAESEATLRRTRQTLFSEYQEDVLHVDHDALAQEAAALPDQQAVSPYPPEIARLLSLRTHANTHREAFAEEPAINAVAWAQTLERFLYVGKDTRLLPSLNMLEEAEEQIARLQQMIGSLRSASERLPQSIPHQTLEDYRRIQLAFQAIEKAGLFPVRWLAARHREEARRALDEILALRKAYLAREEAILKHYDSGVFRLDCEAMLRRFRTDYTSVFKLLKGSYRNDIRQIASYSKSAEKLTDAQIILLLSELIACKEAKAKYEALVESRKALFVDAEVTVIPAWDAVSARLDALSDAEVADVLERLSEDESLGSLQALAALRRAFADHTVAEIFSALSRWMPEVTPETQNRYTLSTLDVKLSVRSLQLAQIARLFAPLESCRHTGVDRDAVCSAMLAMAREHRLLIDEAATHLRAYHTAAAAYETAAANTAAFLGALWQDHQTDWSQAESVLSTFSKPQHAAVFSRLHSIASSRSGEAWMAMFRMLDQHSPEAIIARLNAYALTGRQTAAAVAEDVSGLIDAVGSMTAVLDSATPLFTVPMRSAEKLDALAALVRWAHLEKTAAASEAARRMLSGSAFSGWTTGWDALLSALDQLQAFSQAYPDADMTRAPFRALIANTNRDELAHWTKRTEQITCAYADAYRKCCDLFTNDEWAGAALEAQHMRIAAAAAAPELLDQWQQYELCMRGVRQDGLMQAVEMMRENRTAPDQYTDAYQKAFLLSWVSRQLADAPDVASFDVVAHTANILQFQAQDDQYFEISKVQLQHELTARMPHSSGFSSGELATLKHELNKKTRIMPIRKLFKQIPYLLQALKPCLMMSPLSVSYFLDSAFYQFDMVIFDEASQIFPQDAIGAILRAKQAIIAGDVKQMPPSNFFSASLESEEEEEEDFEEDSTPLGDSILEEASFTLPQTSLLWHYRSRDESLIAFSNRHFYKNDLYTFPNNNVGQPDTGVEYIHVEDGVYHNRRNRREAEKCVMLIYQHIIRHPERSLGVVAFSEAQQAEIEDLLWRQRERLPQYNAFFDEDKDEPFFIKNLENVQGDERDTIIFSICYAHAADGRMRLNFGPLGKAGGERRLNVAVTRARYNVKLIGSILPSDIDLNRAKSEGARLLRSYIEYARAASDTEMAATHSLENHDLFADEVASFLEERGYAVTRDVGRSAYRVDIAVHAKGDSHTYMAGILCDGLGYAEARTVRDRDSIRRKMLANLGWNVIDCWSMEWAEHPENARKALLQKLEDAAEGKKAPLQYETAPVKVVYEIEPLAQAKAADQKALTLPDYHAMRHDSYTLPIHQKQYQSRFTFSQGAILHYIQAEQPLHMDVLYQRMAPHYNREKATSVVKNMVREELSPLIGRYVVVEDDFCMLKSCSTVTARKAGGREVEQISFRELTEVMKTLLQATFGLSTGDVIQESARLLGYSRTGQRIESRLHETLDRMQQQGLVTIVKDKVQWKGDAK